MKWTTIIISVLAAAFALFLLAIHTPPGQAPIPGCKIVTGKIDRGPGSVLPETLKTLKDGKLKPLTIVGSDDILCF